MDILIINLTRMGDIVQSSVLVKNLKKIYKNSFISYLLLDNFKETASLIPEIDKVITLDFSDVLKYVDNFQLDSGFDKLSEIIFNKLDKKYNKLINLSFSKLSGYLSFLIKADEKNGLLFKENNEFIARDSWSRYFLSIVDNREYSPFNLVDIYTKIGIENNKINNDFFKYKSVKLDKINIGFVLGASTKDRQWPARNFAALAKLIFKHYKNSKIYLLGTKNERNLAEEFFSNFHNKSNGELIDLVGKTSLRDLDKLINKEIDILITNDTGTMHIGWYRGKKIIEISLGPALFNTTGPYGEGHIVIQPDLECAPCSYLTKCKDLKCHNVVLPEIVMEAVKFLNNEFLNNDIKYIKKFNNIKILKSFFNKEGYVDYKLISGVETKEITLRKIFRKIWMDTLENCLKKNENYFINYVENGKYKVILSYIKSLIKLIESIDFTESKIDEKVLTILNIEQEIKENIYTFFEELVPFLKYLEYTRNLLPEDNIKLSLNKLKELYYIFYLQIQMIN